MDETYDIFKKLSDKDAVWVETVCVDNVKKRLLHYKAIDSANTYMVFDSKESRFIDVWNESAA
jgi:hypothetical protein